MRGTTLLIAFVALFIALVGCAPSEPNAVDEQPTTARLMDPLLNTASEVFWDSAGFIDTYEGTTDLTPTTAEGWQKVLEAADEIDALSAMLKQERYSLNRAAWNVLADNLIAASESGRQAALARDGAALFQAGADLYQVCVACHQTFWSNNRFTSDGD
ncbi:MAG: hypothetical protein F4W90_02875 [Gammaproteobacteria bacterium]|nr:hypothetical protein [Gammaproteobacteria bacterium]